VSDQEESVVDEKAVIGPTGVPRPQTSSFFALRGTISRQTTLVLGIIGGLAFFGVWEVGHLMTPEESKRFLPSPQTVLSAFWVLLTEKGYIYDIGKSCYRIFGSFFLVCVVAVPLGVLMGCFIKLRALINPTISASRYLPAASFIPLLLVWFGPTDTQKMALLFLGVIFFLIALILDNTKAVQGELVEAALTMGADRRRVVLGVVVPAVAPSIIDSMRNMIAVGWTYLVIAEIVAATDGIGAVMMRAGRFLKVDIIMAGILTIGILGVLTDLAFRLLAHYSFPWDRERRN
jgi:NitT/TauT family transport system permease protein|tara:strand:+ start:13606 stop:14475 length:870 start_codon:yes stop_codon:yes gene_type:complete